MCVDDMLKMILNLIESKSKVSACGQVMIYNKYSNNSETHVTGRHIATWFGLSESPSVLLRRPHDFDSQDKYGRTPLSWATEKGHERVVELFAQ